MTPQWWEDLLTLPEEPPPPPEPEPLAAWWDGEPMPTSEVFHTDGLAWYHAPLPRRWHRCRTQTQGMVGTLGWVERCACGAIRWPGERRWLKKNSRRRSA